MTVAEFQSRFGSKWAAIVREPAFLEAMQIANLNTIQMIGLLTDKQIDEHGKEILADLRGRLAHEEALIELSLPEQRGLEEPEATYPSPEEEALLAGTTAATNGDRTGVRSDFIADFGKPDPVQGTSWTSNVPQSTSNLSLKEKRRANAAKARAAKKLKYQEKLKKRLNK